MTERALETLRLEARSLGTAATRTLDWMEDLRALDGLLKAAVRADLQGTLHAAATVARAVDRGPAVAVLAASSRFADRLVAALTRPLDSTVLARFQGSHTRLPVVGGLLPEADRLGLAVPVRLTREPAVEAVRPLVGDPATGGPPGLASDAAGRRGPEAAIRFDLLSLVEVIELLATVALSHDRDGAGPARRRDELASAVERLVQQVGETPQAAIQPGLTAAEIDLLRSTLEAAHPGHPRLGALAAAGYWTAFSTLAPRTGAIGRRRLAALLWDESAALDALFGELVAALESLSFATEIMAPPQAVRDPASAAGWGQAHSATLLAATTVLGRTPTAREPLAVRTRFGPDVSLSRQRLAMLLAGVTLTIDGTTEATLGATDLILLPTALPDVPPRREDEPAPAADRDGDAWLDRALLRARSLQAFRTMVRRHEASALVVHLDPEAPLSHALAPPLSEWVALTHGHSAAERETAATTLFVAVSAQAGPLPASHAPAAGAGGDWRALAEFLAGFGPADDWLERWGLDHPFDNAFILGAAARAGAVTPPAARRANLPVIAAPGDVLGSAAGRESIAASDRWRRHVRNPATALDEALQTPDGGLLFLAQSVGALAHGRVRQRQLALALANTREQARVALQRFVPLPAVVSDPDWRLRAAKATVARLRRCLDDQGLGDLIARLSLRDAEAAVVFDLAHARHRRRLGPGTDAPPDSGRLLDRLEWAAPLDDPSAEALVRAYAPAVMAHWMAQLRATARAGQTAARTRVPRASLTQIADELLLATDRLALGDRLADRLTALVRRQPQPAIQLRGAASLLAAETVNGFLSDLGFDSPWSSLHPRRPGTLGAPLFERLGAPSAETLAQIDARRIALQFGADWADGYVALVEANLASERGMRFESSLHREIQDILGLLGSRPRDLAS